jgi:hypothetical protein
MHKWNCAISTCSFHWTNFFLLVTFIRPTFTNIGLRSHTLTHVRMSPYFHIHLPTFTYICLHSHTSAYIHILRPTFTYITLCSHT